MLLVALLATLALLGGSATVLASGRAVLNDCTDDEVMSKTYSQQDYRDALAQLQGDTDQYGNCRDVIKRAQLAAASAAGAKKEKQDSSAGAAPATGGGGNGGGPAAIGSAPAREQLQAATPTERQAVDEARATAPAAPNATVDPNEVGTVPGVSRVSDLPSPLVAVLALLLVAALALSAVRIRSLVHARRA